MNNDTLDDQLRAYLNGKLPGPERLALDERLAAEPGLAERLAQLRQDMGERLQRACGSSSGWRSS